ncbi:putative lysosomal cobalamin transporter [Trichoplax sp. H2]|nr:putative lysosomal cobalamin transporter [Trichoplax sp. H2]|eukprot:RDD43340.1 putative lysosomal cobalamin transporter [Trichoplax sp. H2]
MEAMHPAIPGDTVIRGVIPFAVVSLLAVLFSFFYTRYYLRRRESETFSTTVIILSMSMALLTSLLLPLDIFFVSSMKNTDGSYKSWAKDEKTRDHIENTIAIAYYGKENYVNKNIVAYGLVIAFAFIILPFTYFYYEEDDEDATVSSRMCGASKYTFGFLLVAIALLLIGAFIPQSSPPANATRFDERLKFLFDEFATNGIERGLSFTIGCLTVLGMLLMAYGMTSLPFDLMIGSPSLNANSFDYETEVINEQTRLLQAKMQNNTGKSYQERRRLDELEQARRTVDRRRSQMEANQNSWFAKIACIWRPFQILAGILLLLLSLLLFSTLLITSIDRILHSLGWKTGYALPKPTITNPIDVTMTFFQEVYPLDYIFFLSILLYVFLSSVSGIRKIGIRFCCIKAYRIHPGRTTTQAMLFMCFFLVLIVLSLNVVMYTIAPRYVTFGSQHYLGNSSYTSDNYNMTQILTTQKCTLEAANEACVETRTVILLFRFCYRIFVFGIIYYWTNWVFLAIFMVTFLAAFVRCRKPSVTSTYIDEDSDYDSDEELLRNS